jgi:hypothetical protein
VTAELLDRAFAGLEREAVVMDNSTEYADPTARLRHARTHTWMNPRARC